MDDELIRGIFDAYGVVTRPDLLSLGYDDKHIRRLIRSGTWTRVRNGAYVPSEAWSTANQLDRHRMRALSVYRSLGDRVAFSHITAAALHGMALWNAPLGRVHVTRLDGGPSRIERDLTHHSGRLLADELSTVDGQRVTSPLRTVLDITALLPVEAALVVADSALHQGMFSTDELISRHDALPRMPGLRTGHIVTRLADPLSGSPGETRVRYHCFRQGLPKPVLQYEVRDALGRLVGITDFAWPDHGLLAEFDGKVKYGALLRPGQSPTDVVFAEKRREDLIREITGFRLIRITWDELNQPVELARRIGSHLNRIA